MKRITLNNKNETRDKGKEQHHDPLERRTHKTNIYPRLVANNTAVIN
jgi:hypothetical protein